MEMGDISVPSVTIAIKALIHQFLAPVGLIYRIKELPIDLLAFHVIQDFTVMELD